MAEFLDLIKDIENAGLQNAIFSNPIDKEKGSKITVHPILLKGEAVYQRTSFVGTKVFHENLAPDRLAEQLTQDMQAFKQAEFTTPDFSAYVLVSKKGKMTIKKKMTPGADKKSTDKAQSMTDKKSMHGNVPAGLEIAEHNRKKHYILEEGKPVDFLVGLGVQTPEGKIVKAKYDKFRQINRYLEFIEDIVRKLPTDRPVRIIDFGCGKSYLTFAMYYYLHVLRKYEVEITGLDLKEDVIALCNKLAEQYGYEHLHFERGDISSYEGEDKVDMVVTLHACDTATDYAIEKAVKWNAGVIMVVPCCQHELNRQISCKELQPVLKYGLIRERMAALMTDALRADMLEKMGYEVQILEFIDMEHTPKNILIRAVKKNGIRKKSGDVEKVTAFLHVQPTLQKLLGKEQAE